jgi:fluoroquinolone transport system permease protein
MASIVYLFIGEVTRLWKYKILLFGLIVTSLWLLILVFVTKNEALALLPQLMVLDSGVMAILLVASSYYFEKQEGTLKALLVSPISNIQLLIAKVFASCVSGVLSLIFMFIVMVVIHGTFIPIHIAFLITLLSTVTHMSLGFVIIFLSRDFMTLLVRYSFFTIALLLPTILFPLDVLPESFSFLYFLSPTYAVQFLIQGLFTSLDTISIVFALGALILIPTLLFPLYIYPRFKLEVVL